MVKNKHGGNRHKKMASKNAKPQTYNRKVRFSSSNDEIYAKVEKVYGGNRALVMCNDGHERMMEWRRKFYKEFEFAFNYNYAINSSKDEDNFSYDKHIVAFEFQYIPKF